MLYSWLDKQKEWIHAQSASRPTVLSNRNLYRPQNPLVFAYGITVPKSHKTTCCLYHIV